MQFSRSADFQAWGREVRKAGAPGDKEGRKFPSGALAVEAQAAGTAWGRDVSCPPPALSLHPGGFLGDPSALAVGSLPF